MGRAGGVAGEHTPPALGFWLLHKGPFFFGMARRGNVLCELRVMHDSEEPARTVLCLELSPCSVRGIGVGKNNGVPTYAAVQTLCATDDVVDGHDAAVAATISFFRCLVYDNEEAVFEELLGCCNGNV